MDVVTILGPTASGKTRLAVALARRTGGEILSADSRQVYRRMDIGTGKDLDEYGNVPFHLIDICEPGTKYNLFQYQRDFYRAYDDIRRHRRLPIVCGGTGLYIEAVLKGYRLSPVEQDPVLRARLEGKPMEELAAMLRTLKERNGSAMHNTTDVDTPQRAIRAIEIELATTTREEAQAREPLKGPVIGVSIDREQRRQKITDRLKARLEAGMADEVRRLLDEGIAPDDLIYYGLEYRYVTEYVLGRTTFDEMFSRLEIAIHQFAKRQMTWFRGMERRGTTIHWIDAALTTGEMLQKMERILADWQDAGRAS